MDDRPPGIRRVCVAVDTEPCSGRSDEERTSAARRLSMALAAACSSSGLDRMLLNSRDSGDGEVALLPVGIDEPRAVALLVDGLFEALHRINGPLNGNSRIRLRMAVHEGITILAAGGFAGHAVVKTRRLLDSRPLRAALAGSPHADLAVLLSDQVFEDVGRFGHPRLPADRFQRVEVDNPPGEFCDIGWIYVPGQGDGGVSARDQR